MAKDDLLGSLGSLRVSVSVLFVLIVAYGLFKLSTVGRRPAGLPPGPRTLPLLGNLHMMPTTKPYKRFKEMGEKHGPIFSLMMGSSPIVMIQSQQIARDLLDKRGLIYSSRPDMHILFELASRELRQLAMKYTPDWRHVHRLQQKILSSKTTEAFAPYQMLESRQLVVDLLDEPQAYRKHVQRYGNSVACQMIYGFRTTDPEDPRLRRIVTHFFEICDLATTVGARIMDCYPVLQKIPSSLLPVCRKAVGLERACTGAFVEAWREAKQRVLDGKSAPCFVVELVQAQAAEGFTDEQASYMAGDIVMAGSATSADELVGFLMAMVTHPEVQRRAHEEVDRVVGPDRLPTIDDMASMPYVRGCVRETMRWMPTTALLIPHAPVRDDVYGEYTIPKGTAIIVNNWALNMDPERWPNPSVFDPLRFANETRSEHAVATSSDPDVKRHNYIFGAGRRLCPGIHIAERNLFLTMACILWGFDMSTPDPSKIDTDDLRGGLAVAPAPFEYSVTPRDKHRSALARSEWARAQASHLDPVTHQWDKAKLPSGLPACTYGKSEDDPF